MWWRLRQLRSRHWQTCRQAAEKLGNAKETRAVKPLMGLLSSTRLPLRREAAIALGKIGDLRAVDSLMKALNDKYKSVREAAAWALGELGDVRAVESLLVILEDANADVERAAAVALGKLGDRRAIGPLESALNNENADMRMAITSDEVALYGVSVRGSYSKHGRGKGLRMWRERRTVKISIFLLSVMVLVIVIMALNIRVLVGIERIGEIRRKATGSQVAEPPERVEVVQYIIQISSFNSYQNAAIMVNSLRADGHTCWMKPENPSDIEDTIYRVFVGRFRTRKVAELMAEFLSKRRPNITGYMIKEIKE